MGLFKFAIIVGLLILGYVKLVPESSKEIIEDKAKKLVEDEFLNETIEENITAENSGSIEKKYLGKPKKVLEYPCVSDDDCVESYCDIENGECYIYNQN